MHCNRLFFYGILSMQILQVERDKNYGHMCRCNDVLLILVTLCFHAATNWMFRSSFQNPLSLLPDDFGKSMNWATPAKRAAMLASCPRIVNVPTLMIMVIKSSRGKTERKIGVNSSTCNHPEIPVTCLL